MPSFRKISRKTLRIDFVLDSIWILDFTTSNGKIEIQRHTPPMPPASIDWTRPIHRRLNLQSNQLISWFSYLILDEDLDFLKIETLILYIHSHRKRKNILASLGTLSRLSHETGQLYLLVSKWILSIGKKLYWNYGGQSLSALVVYIWSARLGTKWMKKRMLPWNQRSHSPECSRNFYFWNFWSNSDRNHRHRRALNFPQHSPTTQEKFQRRDLDVFLPGSDQEMTIG